jgi:enolase
VPSSTSSPARSSTARGNPTVEADVLLESGVMGRAAVPSGASTGTREAIELRDGDKTRYLGKGVLKAVEHVNTEISKRSSASTRRAVASSTDADRPRRHREQGPPRRQRDPRGVAGGGQGRRRGIRPAAVPLLRRQRARMQLPVPMMNVINGGAHANNNLDLQEFMIMPVGARFVPRSAALRRRDLPRAEEDARRPRHERPRSATKAASRRNLPNEAALQLILEAIEQGRLQAGRARACSGLDCAASEFYKDGKYVLEAKACA